jgi:hypothetical protein
MTQKKVSIQKWSPSPSEFLKINTDGAFYESLKAGGWGFTVRDDRGLLIAAGAAEQETWNIYLTPSMQKHWHCYMH